MSVIYKTLFEVKVLHEFYLTDKDGTSIFEESTQQDRLSFLEENFSLAFPTINNDLNFEIPEQIKSVFKNYHLRLINTYSGFKVAVEVTKSLLLDGTTMYKPLIPLPPDLNLLIELNKSGNDLDRITNSRINTPIPSVYYFSNENISETKPFPFLSNSISAKDISANYEQGELAYAGGGLIQSFYENDSGSQWFSVAGNGFANENDRLVVPLNFYYSFGKNSNVNQAQFILKNSDGEIVKDKQGNIPAPLIAAETAGLQKALLNFDSLELKTISENPSSEKVIYTLEVTGNNGYSKKHAIIFYGKKTNKNTWGFVQLKPRVSNADYNIIDDNGFIFFQKNPEGSIKNPAPLFEIRVKSRFSYWRYMNINNNELQLTSVTTPYLDKKSSCLITKTPRNLTSSLTLFPLDTYLPNPFSDEQLNISNGRLFTNIKVPKSELFPIT